MAETAALLDIMPLAGWVISTYFHHPDISLPLSYESYELHSKKHMMKVWEVPRISVQTVAHILDLLCFPSAKINDLLFMKV